MHRVHHYPMWMLAFDCIAFCIYVHCYPIRSLPFVSVILHGHSAFTCTVILYGHYVLSLLSYTDIWHLRALLSHTVAMFHLCYPTRTLHFVCTAIPCGCHIFSVILHGRSHLCTPLFYADVTFFYAYHTVYNAFCMMSIP